MEQITLRYILSRAISIIVLVVIALYLVGHMKKRSRQNDVVSELKSLSSDSSFFNQFSPEDARKSLIRAVGLVAEARKLGLEPEKAINRGLGIEKKYFAMGDDGKELDSRQRIIMRTFRSNYENFRKLGYEPDFHILESMAKGDLPPIRKGPRAGMRAEVVAIIDPELSPGLDRVLANLEIRPADSGGSEMTDVEIAAARSLVIDLAKAGVIESNAEKRILEDLAKRAKGPENREDKEEE